MGALLQHQSTLKPAFVSGLIGDITRVNKVCGSFAQLFTQTLKVVEGPSQIRVMKKVVGAVGDYLHKPYHIRMFWFMVAQIRRHYGNSRDK